MPPIVWGTGMYPVQLSARGEEALKKHHETPVDITRGLLTTLVAGGTLLASFACSNKNSKWKTPARLVSVALAGQGAVQLARGLHRQHHPEFQRVAFSRTIT